MVLHWINKENVHYFILQDGLVAKQQTLLKTAENAKSSKKIAKMQINFNHRYTRVKYLGEGVAQIFVWGSQGFPEELPGVPYFGFYCI